MVKEIKKEIAVIKQVEDFTISTQEDMTPATALLSQCNKVLDSLTDEKEKLTVPLNKALKEIRARYKPAEEQLESAIATIKAKMNVFQTRALVAQREAEEKIASKLANGSIKITTALKKLDNIEAPETRIKADEGSVSFRAVRKCEVVDMALLPIAYHVADEVAIRKAMLSGVELPGVRYYEEQQITNRRS